jgi:outer membrane immunogenic protein
MKTQMFRTILAGALIAATSGAGFAADLQRREMPVAATAPTYALYNWSGAYIGAHLGGDWFRNEATVGGSRVNSDGSTVFGGAQIGYNFQTGPWVMGLEADAGYGNATKTVGIGLLTLRTEKTWSGTARARAGYAFDNLLVYGTGGLAWATFKSRLGDNFGVFDSNDKTRIGWTAGGGLEYGVSRNVSLKAEYLYADYGRDNTVLGTREKITDHVGRVGVNYRF